MKKQVKAVICIVAVIVVVVVSALVLKAAYSDYTYSSYPLKYQDDVKAASEKYDVSQALIYGVIKTESNFDPDAESHAGAKGLMQITDDTFEWLQTYYKDDNNYTFEDLNDPKINIDYGAHLLSILSKMYESKDTMLCAYNAGVGTVDRWLEEKQYSRDGKTLNEVPYPETDNYRRIVQQNESVYNTLYFGQKNTK